MSQNLPTYPLAPQANPPIRLLAKYQELFTHAPEIVYQAPRRDMWIAARLLNEPRYSVLSLEHAGSTMATFTLQSAKRKQTSTHRPLPKWARFPAGTLVYLSKGDVDARGMVAVVCGDEPSGPRYDYAMSILFAGLWHDLAGKAFTDSRLIEIADRVVREYVGIGV